MLSIALSRELAAVHKLPTHAHAITAVPSVGCVLSSLASSAALLGGVCVDLVGKVGDHGVHERAGPIAQNVLLAVSRDVSSNWYTNAVGIATPLTCAARPNGWDELVFDDPMAVSGTVQCVEIAMPVCRPVALRPVLEAGGHVAGDALLVSIVRRDHRDVAWWCR